MKSVLTDAFKAAWPIMAGYVVLGLPCGLLCQQVGIAPWMAFLFSIFFYSGAGQYMIPNMWLAGVGPLSIILSVSLVNTRQTLYSAALARFTSQTGKLLSFYFAATVTDESFGVNIARFANGDWDVKRAALVNTLSMLSWALANAVGVLIGNLVSVPTAIASFAMTSIFICLLCMQKVNKVNVVTIVAAFVGVVLMKVVGMGSVAILVGAIVGVVAGLVTGKLTAKPEAGDEA